MQKTIIFFLDLMIWMADRADRIIKALRDDPEALPGILAIVGLMAFLFSI